MCITPALSVYQRLKKKKKFGVLGSGDKVADKAKPRIMGN